MSYRWVILIFLSLFLTACGTQPRIVIEPLKFDLGNIPNGQIVSQEVKVTNTGQRPLEITSLTTSCSCTTAELPTYLLQPGETQTLTIAFDSGAHGPGLTGPVLRQIFISSNDPQQPEMIVEFTATILPPP